MQHVVLLTSGIQDVRKRRIHVWSAPMAFPLRLLLNQTCSPGASFTKKKKNYFWSQYTILCSTLLKMNVSRLLKRVPGAEN